MRRLTGGRAVVESLRVEGVEHVFGIVGTNTVHLFDALFDEPALRLVTPRNEQGGALMATGYARASGKIAACFTVPGPGLTMALTGLGMAFSESAPVLLVTGQNPLAILERDLEAFHELPHSLAVAGSLASFVTRLSRPEDAPGAVRDAFRAMRCRRPRPAVLEIPIDVLSAEAEVELLPPQELLPPGGHPAAVERAATALRSAERPLILAGGGVASAGAEADLLALAEALGAPVITSAYAKGVISDEHRLALGDGWGQRGLYDEVLDQADLALAVGWRFDVITDARQGARLPRRLVQIDLDPAMIGQRWPVEAGVVGDAGAVLAELAERLAPSGQPRDCWLDGSAFRARKRARLAELAGPVLEIWDDLRAAAPPESIFVNDLTLVGYWGPLLFEAYQPRSMLHAGTYGTLGYALPAAIGARIACPTRPVVAICGDGGLLYTVQELATARAERLDLVVVVFNDNAFGALKTYQNRLLSGRQIGAELVNPDFVKLSDAFGAQGLRVGPGELGPAVQRAIATGGVWLIEVPFAPPEPYSIPPWMT